MPGSCGQPWLGPRVTRRRAPSRAPSARTATERNGPRGARRDRVRRHVVERAAAAGHGHRDGPSLRLHAAPARHAQLRQRRRFQLDLAACGRRQRRRTGWLALTENDGQSRYSSFRAARVAADRHDREQPLPVDAQRRSSSFGSLSAPSLLPPPGAAGCRPRRPRPPPPTSIRPAADASSDALPEPRRPTPLLVVALKRAALRRRRRCPWRRPSSP